MDNTKQLEQLINQVNRVADNVSDRVVLKQEELTLSGASAAALPFTGINSLDVKSVEFRVRKTGVPADSTFLAMFTMASGDTPTASHGMYVGNNDLYTVTGNNNVRNFKIIATEAIAHVMYIIYYGAPDKA